MEDEKRRTFVRIPLTAVTMLLLQAAIVLIWATQLDARVNGVEQQILSTRSLNEKFATLDERLDDVKQSITDMKRQLDQLNQNLLQ